MWFVSIPQKSSGSCQHTSLVDTEVVGCAVGVIIVQRGVLFIDCFGTHIYKRMNKIQINLFVWEIYMIYIKKGKNRYKINEMKNMKAIEKCGKVDSHQEAFSLVLVLVNLEDWCTLSQWMWRWSCSEFHYAHVDTMEDEHSIDIGDHRWPLKGFLLWWSHLCAYQDVRLSFPYTLLDIHRQILIEGFMFCSSSMPSDGCFLPLKSNKNT